jgi:hypothetical protein
MPPTATPPPATPPEGTDLEKLFDDWYKTRRGEEERREQMRQEPKDFGEFLDRVSDMVVDKLFVKLAEEEPNDDGGAGGRAGETGTAFQRWWTGKAS